jgi:hypothetical protein
MNNSRQSGKPLRKKSPEHQSITTLLGFLGLSFCWYLHVLFNGPVSSSEYSVSRDSMISEWWITNVVTYLEVIPLPTAIITTTTTTSTTTTTTTNVAPWNRDLLQKLTGPQLVKKKQHFVEAGVSLPHSQNPPHVTILDQINLILVPPS